MLSLPAFSLAFGGTHVGCKVRCKVPIWEHRSYMGSMWLCWQGFIFMCRARGRIRDDRVEIFGWPGRGQRQLVFRPCRLYWPSLPFERTSASERRSWRSSSSEFRPIPILRIGRRCTENSSSTDLVSDKNQPVNLCSATSAISYIYLQYVLLYVYLGVCWRVLVCMHNICTL